MTKCNNCGGPLGKQTWAANLLDGTRATYCSEGCFAVKHPDMARMYGIGQPSAARLDELIDRFVDKPKQEDPIIIYRCDQDEYDIYYAPSLGEATYRFDNGNHVDVDHLTARHVAYYLESGYWHEDHPDANGL